MTRVAAACVLCLVWGRGVVAGQLSPESRSPQAVSPADLQSAIDNLGKLDDDIRTSASRVVRRSPSSLAVPALVDAAAKHPDGYVQYRALVLLTGFNDSRTTASMQAAMASPNDRLRAIAYSFYEHNPDRRLGPRLLAALDRETGEFVRPSLVRALAALGSVADDARIRETLVREAGRGEDFFRSVVIEALGDYKAQYAFDALAGVVKIDGPLQGDTAIALGKLGDTRALDALAALQRTAPKSSQPYLAAAVCLLGVNCELQQKFLADTLRFSDRNPGYQDSLRASAAALEQLAVAGSSFERAAADVLFDVGTSSGESTRAPVSLAVATIALRRTPAMLSVLEARPDRNAAVALLAEGFDGLTEDYEKERFFASARRSYREAAEGSPRRALIQTLIEKLEF